MTLAIISGRSGSAKHIVLRLLENQGYYFIDKLPASLLQSLVHQAFVKTQTARHYKSI